jgi:AcrR family transcriptional regulator
MRSKGLATRQRIIEQTLQLMRSKPPHKVSAADIARACGLTPPGLYLYFDGVPEIMLARLEEIAALEQPFVATLARSWNQESLWDNARVFVHTYANFWREHEIALRYRNLRADQGDDRFKQLRISMTRPIAELLVERVGDSQNEGLIPTTLGGYETAAAALALVDHCAASANSPYGTWGDAELNRHGFLDAATYMLASLMHGSLHTRVPVDLTAAANSTRGVY